MSAPPWEWEEADLNVLISTRRQESIVLDYKRSDALTNTQHNKSEISKDVSALANSAGGVLVYGMKEDGHFPTGLDGGCDPNVTTKEWLEQVINSNIQRRIDGVRVKQIALAYVHPTRVIYVVSVPQSLQAPHQAGDKRFYKRFNFESQPMEEYEVRDVANRSIAPDLRVGLRAERIVAQEAGLPLECWLHGIVSNDSPEPAEHAAIYVYVDPGLAVLEAPGCIARDNAEIRWADGKLRVWAIRQLWKPPQFMPIFQHEDQELTPQPIRLRVLPHVPMRGSISFLLGWEIKAPHMSVRSAYTMLDVIDERPTVRVGWLDLATVIAELDSAAR